MYVCIFSFINSPANNSKRLLYAKCCPRCYHSTTEQAGAACKWQSYEEDIQNPNRHTMSASNTTV